VKNCFWWAIQNAYSLCICNYVCYSRNVLDQIY